VYIIGGRETRHIPVRAVGVCHLRADAQPLRPHLHDPAGYIRIPVQVRENALRVSNNAQRCSSGR